MIPVFVVWITKLGICFIKHIAIGYPVQLIKEGFARAKFDSGTKLFAH